jgi:malate dehydrogenase (oxaloacetate-decarboxylating)(NADP+)
MDASSASQAEGAIRARTLEYHRAEPAGKLGVAPTRPLNGRDELALAYSPGVAYPC